MKNVVPCCISCCLLSFPASFPALLSLCCKTLWREHEGWPLSDQVLLVWVSLTPRHPGETTKLVTLNSISKLNSVSEGKTYYLGWFVLVILWACLDSWNALQHPLLENFEILLPDVHRLFSKTSFHENSFFCCHDNFTICASFVFWIWFCEALHSLHTYFCKWPELELFSMSGISATGTQSKKIFWE